tara:strand:+ start:1023 stop:1220 length:198 start_codon:yes stop_codon:yes gene_type:complete
MNNTRKITLKDGGILEVSCTDELISQIKKHYNMASGHEVLDHHISDYIINACQAAVEKAEIDTND